MDLGAPASYLTLAAGIPVFSSDGQRLGDVEHVLAEPEKDIFDGIVFDASPLPGGHRFVDAPDVDVIYERGVVLKLDAGSAADTRWIDDRDDLPRIIRAGRHLARPKRYIRNYAHEIEPHELAAYVAQEADRGDGWVKLVGDWIDRDIEDLAPLWPLDALTDEELVKTFEINFYAYVRLTRAALRHMLPGAAIIVTSIRATIRTVKAQP